MKAIISWLEMAFGSVPIPILEVWGRFGYFIGFALALCAFGGFTFRLGSRWGFGRERQSWDAKAFLAIPVTFVLIVVTGYLGSSVVLVQGAQTFESLKDLVVFVCITIFGYPALITVPFAYALADLIEGVPPGFLMDWLPGYFINPACFWVAYQLFGKNPDFRIGRTWLKYAVFVVFFMSIEPILWGFICADKFTPAISYGVITPALFFTTSVTWVLAPPTMLVALPLARSLGLFWADIVGHVRERAVGSAEWIWESGGGRERDADDDSGEGIPIRMFLLAPLIAFVLVMVALTAIVTLQTAEKDATKLASRLHQEVSQNIHLQLDGYLAQLQQSSDSIRLVDIDQLLGRLPIAVEGRAFIVDGSGNLVASSTDKLDAIVVTAITAFRLASPSMQPLVNGEFRFDHITARPPSREGWFGHALAYQDSTRGAVGWILMTAMPEQYYLAGVRDGNSRSAAVFAIALLLSLAVAAALSAMVVEPLRGLSRATRRMARGELKQRVPDSRLRELDTLAHSLNNMAAQLENSFTELVSEVQKRKLREAELVDAEQELRQHRDHLEELVEERTAELSVAAGQLSDMYLRLKSLEELRDNLVHMVIHDMRSPLTVLLANLSFLRQGPAGKLSDVAEDIGGAIQSAHDVNRMANDLLDVSRLEEGKMPIGYSLANIGAIASEACTSLSAWDPERTIVVDAPEPVIANCDSKLVRRIIENLLSNAIKHTPAGGNIRVVVESRGAVVRVAIHDNGPGVPLEAQAKIFEKFGTLQVREEKAYHSAGLGLAFCKLAVEAHNGRIGVDSREGEGSTFWFELPK